ncbi:hypothetical protein, partial [Streptomyces sp. NPDC058612]|uniref:hypothetical protein n=1 Tax=Streptomyces sp. NPDC058612 TaxID=3346555 RepID=UPI0036658E8B
MPSRPRGGRGRRGCPGGGRGDDGGDGLVDARSSRVRVDEDPGDVDALGVEPDIAAAMSGQAGEARIASHTRPPGIVAVRRSAHRSVPSAFVRAALATTAWWTPAV